MPRAGQPSDLQEIPQEAAQASQSADLEEGNRAAAQAGKVSAKTAGASAQDQANGAADQGQNGLVDGPVLDDETASLIDQIDGIEGLEAAQAGGMRPVDGVPGQNGPEFSALNPEDQKLIDELAGDAAITDSLGANEPGPSPLGFGEELKARITAGLGRNPEEEKSLLAKALGPGFEVEFKGKELYFRKKGSKQSFPLDRAAFTGGMRELVMDLVGDTSGMALETGVGVGVTAAGAAVGGPAGAAAAVIPASALQVAARDAAIRALGGEASANIPQELALNTGLNAASLGLGAILKGVGKATLGALRETLEKAPMKRVEQLAKIRFETENLASEIGRKQLTSAESGEVIHDAIQGLNKSLDDKVSLVKRDIVSRAGEAPYAANRYAAKLGQILENIGVSKEEQAQLRDPKIRSELVQRLRDSKALGGDTGAEFADEVIEQKLRLEKKGGLQAQEMFNLLDYWKQPAGYKQGAKVEYPSAVQALSRQVRTELAQDRNDMTLKLFANDPDKGAFITNAMKDYAGKIDTIKQFRDLFRTSRKNSERFMSSIVKPKNSGQIRELKGLLGEDSTEWGLVKAEWMDNVLKKSIEAQTGVVKGNAVQTELARYGDDVVDEMLKPDQRKALEFLAKRAEKIAYLDILGDKQAEQFLKDTAAVAIAKYKQPSIIVRTLWQLTRSNAEAAKYLADDGLMQLAMTMKDPVEQRSLIKVIDSFQKLMASTDVYSSKSGKNALELKQFEQKLKDPKIQKMLEQDPGYRKTVEQIREQLMSKQAPRPVAPGAPALGSSQAVQGFLNEGQRPKEAP